MSSRAGGKQKPLKAPKKEKGEMTEDDIAVKKKAQEEAKALKAMADKLKKK
jgi:hypothetical protein